MAMAQAQHIFQWSEPQAADGHRRGQRLLRSRPRWTADVSSRWRRELMAHVCHVSMELSKGVLEDFRLAAHGHGKQSRVGDVQALRSALHDVSV